MRYSFIRLAFCALLAVAPGLAGAATIDVPGDYLTIQEAVDAAATNGDTIDVAAGTYNVTQVKIASKSLTLHGAGAATTIIDGGKTPGIWYTGTVLVYQPTGPVLVEGFTIREAGTGTDLYTECLAASDFEYPVTVRNCHFIGHGLVGLHDDMGAYGASGHEEGRFIVENCEFEKMWQAILMERTTAGCSILNNYFHHLHAYSYPGTLYEAEGVFFMTYGGALFDANGLVEVSGNRFTDFVGSDIIVAGGYGPDKDTSKVNHVEIKDNRIEAIGSGPERGHDGITLVNYGDDPEEAANGGVHNALVTGNVLTGTGGLDSYGIRIWGWCSNINACGNAISSLDWGLIVEEKVLDAGCATGVAAHYNTISGNTTGMQNDSLTDAIDALYNWWGDLTGPNPPGSGDPVVGLINVDPWLGQVPAEMWLGVAAGYLYVKPGGAVPVTLNQLDLQTLMSGYRAFLFFDPDMLTFASGTYTADPYGDWLIDPIVASGPNIEAAAQIQGPQTSTSADAEFATLNFTAGTTEGTTQLDFRTDTEPTRFTTEAGCHIIPTTAASPLITIDGTAPTINIISAKFGGLELIGTANTAARGVVNIQVTASDILSGLAGPPTVTVTPRGAIAQAATYVNESPAGTFNYTWTVTAATPNGTATIDATVSDRSGNVANATPKEFVVYEFHCVVIVQLEGIVAGPIARTISFVFGNGAGYTWSTTKNVTFTGGIGNTTIDDTAHAALWKCISAKDDVHTLWRKQCITIPGVQDTAANFTGVTQLLGGDLNNDDVCDIWDYGILAAQYGPPPPLTGFNADINLDNRVWKQDLVILYARYLTPGYLPCDQPAVPTPVSRITIAQLAAIVGGMANARKADMDHNNIINTTDLRVFYTRNICIR